MSLFYLILSLFIGSIGSVGLAALMLLLKNDKLDKLATYLSYFAGGTLLGAAFLGMLPKAIELLNAKTVLILVLGGILFFFILEKIILWRSCKNNNCERHSSASIAPIILIGDAFHNAIDGIVIAASFLTSVELGFFATISVVLHEIPQELGDFGILIKSGYSKRKALFYNALSGSTAIILGIIAYFILEEVKMLIPWALSFSAASFLYIALADLIPEMHRKTKVSESILQFLLISLGISLIALIIMTK